MNRSLLTQSFLILFLALAVQLAPIATREATASNIVAVVNGAVITDFDIGQRQRLERLLSGGQKRLGKSAALNQLIDDKLKLFEARTRKMTATDKQVANAMKNMARNVRMSEKQMVGVFRQAGINKATVQDWLKVQLSWNSLVGARSNAQVRVEEADIVRALTKQKGEDKSVESAVQYDLTQITFVTRTKASKRELSQKLAEAKRFRGSFASCKTDIDKARKLRDVAVGSVGRRTSTDLHPELAKRLRDTPLNKLTPPTKVDNGYEMLAVCGKKDLGKRAALRNQAESKLRDEQGRAVSRKYLRELRSRAIIERR